jgi:hypothetical protein
MLGERDPQGFGWAALRWLQRFIEERLPPVAEVALAAASLAELRYGDRGAGRNSLERLARPRRCR